MIATRKLRFTLAFCVAGALAALAAPMAGAHVQVKPLEAAPGDAVEFTVLVPGETAARTVKVALQIPKDVIPFSFGATPGWKLTKQEAADGSIAQLVWRGSMEPDGFTEFRFLASTPEKPTTIVWKAIQTYSDGEVVRWIGSPASEYPASRTVVTESAEVQGAGGSHSGKQPGSKTADDTEGSAAPSWAGAAAVVALALGLLALVLAGAALRKSDKRS